MTATVATDGDFQVPAGAGAVVAFHDANGNGVADLFAEPTTQCAHERGVWRCDLGRTRIAAHRTTAALVDDVATTDTDSLTLRAERYLADGIAIARGDS